MARVIFVRKKILNIIFKINGFESPIIPMILRQIIEINQFKIWIIFFLKSLGKSTTAEIKAILNNKWIRAGSDGKALDGTDVTGFDLFL